MSATSKIYATGVIVQTTFLPLNRTVNVCDVGSPECTCNAQDLLPFGECVCQVPKKNFVVLKLESLKADIATLDYKLKHLTPYFSQAQIRCWRVNRRELAKKLKFFEGIRKKQLAEKPVKHILSSPHRQTV